MKFLHEIERNSVSFVTVFAIFVKLPPLRSYPKKKSCQEGLFLANLLQRVTINNISYRRQPSGTQ